MAVALFVGGAALGAVFGEVLRLVSEQTRITLTFKSELKKLESTLQSLPKNMEDIEKFNRELDRPKQETAELLETLEKVKKVVIKCSKRKVKWNIFYRNYYAKKLLELDGSIVRFCQVNMQAQLARDNKEILFDLKHVHLMVKKLSDHGGQEIKSIGLIGACSVPDPPEKTPGLDLALNELKMDLLKMDGNRVIVVSAAGGSGKTTLVTKLCQDNDVKGKFQDNIFFVTVSQKQDVKVIVQKIFQHKRYDVPKFGTDEDAINHLERLLKQIGAEAILLVLDDVWFGSESLLQDLSKFKLPNYKILVTSRSVFPKFGPGHILKPLNDEAAMKIFLDAAIQDDVDSYIPDDDLVNKILRACKGSPLALKVVGRLLSGELAEVWQRTVEEWNQGVSIFHENTDLLKCLQSSFDALDNDLKECYMDLGSFPEDQRIPITALIDMWSELYKPSGEDGRYVITNLRKLSNRNLVNLVVTRKKASDDGRYKAYNDHFATQHDLLRDLSIYQSTSKPIEQTKRLIIDINGNSFPNWWLEQEQHPFNARLLSISTDETFSSSWHDMEVPKVEVVLLNIRSMKYSLPNFMEKMDKLKVLIVTNYGFLPSELSNFWRVGSMSNLKRIRLEHFSIPSFGMNMIPMVNLRKISLLICNVGQVFRNSTLKISDAFPNLFDLEIDYCSDLVELPDGLCDIILLKKLSISNCHKLSELPKEIGKLANLELLRLASCTDLSALPDSIGDLSNLNFLDISDCLSIKELPTQIGELCNLKTLCMKGCSSCELPASIINLENLKVKCDEETACQWEPFEPYLSNLKIEVLEEDINLNWLH